MEAKRHKRPTGLALDPDILDRVEAWIGSREYPVTKTWVFETALSEFLGKRNDAWPIDKTEPK